MEVANRFLKRADDYLDRPFLISDAPGPLYSVVIIFFPAFRRATFTRGSSSDLNEKDVSFSSLNSSRSLLLCESADFTLVELLAVIAIIGIFIALLLLAVQSAVRTNTSRRGAGGGTFTFI